MLKSIERRGERGRDGGAERSMRERIGIRPDRLSLELPTKVYKRAGREASMLQRSCFRPFFFLLLLLDRIL